MSVDWVTIEDAIHAWVVAGSGLDGANVIWANQDVPIPASGAYIMIRATARPIGRGWLNYSTNPGEPAGEELIEEHNSMAEVEVQLTAFDGDATGASRGSNLIMRCRAYAQFSAQRALFKAAGWAPARWSDIQDISQIVGAGGGSLFEPRALASAFGFSSVNLQSTSTYIEIVEMVHETPDPDQNITIDLVNQTVTVS